MSAAAAVSEDFASLSPGDPAPRVHQRSSTNTRYYLDTAGGRYIVLCFFASADFSFSASTCETAALYLVSL